MNDLFKPWAEQEDNQFAAGLHPYFLERGAFGSFIRPKNGYFDRLEHYDTDGKCVGFSYRGGLLAAGWVHEDLNENNIGKTLDGFDFGGLHNGHWYHITNEGKTLSNCKKVSEDLWLYYDGETEIGRIVRRQGRWRYDFDPKASISVKVSPPPTRPLVVSLGADARGKPKDSEISALLHPFFIMAGALSSADNFGNLYHYKANGRSAGFSVQADDGWEHHDMGNKTVGFTKQKEGKPGHWLQLDKAGNVLTCVHQYREDWGHTSANDEYLGNTEIRDGKIWRHAFNKDSSFAPYSVFAALPQRKSGPQAVKTTTQHYFLRF